jgi:hypothetical protein
MPSVGGAKFNYWTARQETIFTMKQDHHLNKTENIWLSAADYFPVFLSTWISRRNKLDFIMIYYIKVVPGRPQ